MVENDVEWQEIFAEALRLVGHQVDVFANLGAAKQVFSSNHYDAVIVDGYLQRSGFRRKGDGDEWAEELHAQGERVISVASVQRASGVPYVDVKGRGLEGLEQLIQML